MSAERCGSIEPLLSALVDGELPAEERAHVDAHLQACPSCRGELVELRRTSALLGSLPVRELPRGLADTLDPAAAQPPVGRMAGVAVAVLAAAALGAAFTLGAQPDTSERTVVVPVEAFVADHIDQQAGSVSSLRPVGAGR